jgi:hypothetical protein
VSGSEPTQCSDPSTSVDIELTCICRGRRLRGPRRSGVTSVGLGPDGPRARLQQGSEARRVVPLRQRRLRQRLCPMHAAWVGRADGGDRHSGCVQCCAVRDQLLLQVLDQILHLLEELIMSVRFGRSNTIRRRTGMWSGAERAVSYPHW